MTTTAAYLGVILIWTTTPLAVHWSGQDVGPLFGLTARMTLALMLLTLLLRPFKVKLAWHRRARLVYLASGVGIYLAMTSVYWAAQRIPTGWISVIFGLSPLMTGLMASRWLGDAVLGRMKSLGLLMGLAGLVAIFGEARGLGEEVVPGLLAMLFSVFAHSASTVWVKRHNRRLPALAVTTGGLYVAVPLLLLTWFLTGQTWPEAIGLRTGMAIAYLGVVATVIGFVLYYYLLQQVGPVRVSLITLVTPVLALLLGNALNGEPLTLSVWLGAGLVMAGLACFEWQALGRLIRLRRALAEVERSAVSPD